jgi:hypothetical protein
LLLLDALYLSVNDVKVELAAEENFLEKAIK